MRFPNRFRIVYWLVVTGVVSAYLGMRLPDLRAGVATAADAVAIVVWLALVLVPIFAEVEIFGIRLRAQLDELKTEVKRDLADVRADVRNAIDVRATVSPVFNLSPAPDQQLAQLREIVKQEVAQHVAVPPLEPHAKASQVPPVDPAVSELFTIRYHLERELTRISESRFNSEMTLGRPPGALTVLRGLVDFGLLSADLASAIREVYAICSAAIHGRAPSNAQLAFVRDLGPTAFAALKAL